MFLVKLKKRRKILNWIVNWNVNYFNLNWNGKINYEYVKLRIGFEIRIEFQVGEWINSDGN